MTDDNRRVASTSDDGPGRLRRVVAQRYSTIVLLLVVLLVIGGAFTATTLAGSDADDGQENPVTVSDAGEFTHSAEVQNGTTVFEEGEQLQERGTYFTGVAPELDVEYEYRHETADADLDVETELQMELQSTDDDEVYWEQSEPFGNETAVSVPAGETLTVDGTVDMAELTERVDTIEDELGSSPGEAAVRVVARSTIDGTVGNETVSTVRADTLVITPDDETYSVEATMDDAGMGSQTGAATATAEASWLRTVGAPLLFAASLLGLVAVVGAEKRGALRLPADAEHLSDRNRFDDWITQGSLPESLAVRPTIDVDSLEGLVDVAIDSDCRVIEEPETNRYYVAQDSVLYRYEPGIDTESSESDAEPESARDDGTDE